MNKKLGTKSGVKNNLSSSKKVKSKNKKVLGKIEPKRNVSKGLSEMKIGSETNSIKSNFERWMLVFWIVVGIGIPLVLVMFR